MKQLTVMYKEPFTSVHGLSIEELEGLLREALPGNIIDISPYLMNGWSNLNIPIIINKQKGVLKLPGLMTEFKTNPFEKEYSILSTLHTQGISPRPLFIGRLNNDKQTSFMIYEYVEGRVINSLGVFSNVERSLLKQSLSTLSQIHVSCIPIFKSTNAYLDSIRERISNVQQEFGSKGFISDVFVKFEAQLNSIDSHINDVEWRTGFMHGDLQENNIVFCENRAILLDFEFSAIGDPLFDIVYLHYQHVHSTAIDESLILEGDSVERAISLVPLVLASVICWSVEYLTYYYNGLLEPNIMVKKSPDSVALYIRAKLRELQQGLETI